MTLEIWIKGYKEGSWEVVCRWGGVSSFAATLKTQSWGYVSDKFQISALWKWDWFKTYYGLSCYWQIWLKEVSEQHMATLYRHYGRYKWQAENTCPYYHHHLKVFIKQRFPFISSSLNQIDPAGKNSREETVGSCFERLDNNLHSSQKSSVSL